MTLSRYLTSILVICAHAGFVHGHAKSTGFFPAQERSNGQSSQIPRSSQTPSPINPYFDSTTESFEEKIARSQHFDAPMQYYRTAVSFNPEPVGGYAAWRNPELQETGNNNGDLSNILQLGKIAGTFEGPRKRRSTNEEEGVFFVYPEHYSETAQTPISGSASTDPSHYQVHGIETEKSVSDAESQHSDGLLKNHKSDGFEKYAAFRSSEMQDAKFNPKGSPSDILLLGKPMGAFEGPRRRRFTSQSQERVFYVYPEHYNLDNVMTEETTTATTKSSTMSSNDVLASYEDQSGSSKTNTHTQFNERSSVNEIKPTPTQTPLTLDQYIAKSWLDYGPKSVPQPVSSNQGQNLPVQAHPGVTFPFNPSPPTPLLLPGHHITSLRPYSYQFQRKGDLLSSPWDDRILSSPDPTLPPEDRPSILSPLLHRYIDFEVNNHDSADLMRKLLFGFVIGTLVAAWIGLGVLLGFFPMNLLFLTKSEEQSTTPSGTSTRANEDLEKRNLQATRSELNNLTDKVYLALESNWLVALEESVKANSSSGKIGLTIAKCCVVPEEEYVECKLVKVPHNKYDVGKPIKCESDLIYNFKFGENDV